MTYNQLVYSSGVLSNVFNGWKQKKKKIAKLSNFCGIVLIHVYAIQNGFQCTYMQYIR